MKKETILSKFSKWLDSDEATEVELAEETTEETKEETKLESVLEDGTYELADGRSIVIEGGNLTEVLPAAESEEEAPAMDEELAKEENLSEVEKTESEIMLEKQNVILEDLQAKIIELEKAEPLNSAPQKKKPQEQIKLTSDMDLVTKARVRRYNRKIK